MPLGGTSLPRQLRGRNQTKTFASETAPAANRPTAAEQSETVPTALIETERTVTDLTATEQIETVPTAAASTETEQIVTVFENPSRSTIVIDLVITMWMIDAVYQAGSAIDAERTGMTVAEAAADRVATRHPLPKRLCPIAVVDTARLSDHTEATLWQGATNRLCVRHQLHRMTEVTVESVLWSTV